MGAILSQLPLLRKKMSLLTASILFLHNYKRQPSRGRPQLDRGDEG